MSLGHSDIAAQGFSTGRKDVIRKALRYVEASGDAEGYTAELSRVFFAHLRDACHSFMDLFSHKVSTGPTTSVTTIPKLRLPSSGTDCKTQGTPEEAGPYGVEHSAAEDENMVSLSYLIGWIQEQMAVFVAALSRQFLMGAGEYVAHVFEHDATFLRCYHENMLKREIAEAAEAAASPKLARSMSRGEVDQVAYFLSCPDVDNTPCVPQASARLSGRFSTPQLRVSGEDFELSRRESYRGKVMSRKSRWVWVSRHEGLYS